MLHYRLLFCLVLRFLLHVCTALVASRMPRTPVRRVAAPATRSRSSAGRSTTSVSTSSLHPWPGCRHKMHGIVCQWINICAKNGDKQRARERLTVEAECTQTINRFLFAPVLLIRDQLSGFSTFDQLSVIGHVCLPSFRFHPYVAAFVRGYPTARAPLPPTLSSPSVQGEDSYTKLPYTHPLSLHFSCPQTYRHLVKLKPFTASCSLPNTDL